MGKQKDSRQFIMMFAKKPSEKFQCQWDEFCADTAYYFLDVVIVEDGKIISNHWAGQNLMLDSHSEMEIDWDAFWSQISHYDFKQVNYRINSEKYDEDYLKRNKYIYLTVPSIVENYLIKGGSEEDVLIALTQIGRHKIQCLVREINVKDNNSEPTLSVSTVPGIYSTFPRLSAEELSQRLAPPPKPYFSVIGADFDDFPKL